MTLYQYPNSSYKGIEGFIRIVNDNSGGLMMPLFLLVLWVVFLVSLLGYGFPRAFLSSSFMVSILSTLLVILGFLAPAYMYISFIFTALGVFFVRLNFT